MQVRKQAKDISQDKQHPSWLTTVKSEIRKIHLTTNNTQLKEEMTNEISKYLRQNEDESTNDHNCGASKGLHVSVSAH